MLHGALSSTSYEEAVRRTILAGGDNCSRATLLGALFGAEVRPLPGPLNPSLLKRHPSGR